MGKPWDILSTTTTPIITTTIIKSDIKCSINYAELYYSPSCPHCQHQLSDGSVGNLTSYGMTIKLFNVNDAEYNITYVPTWKWNNQEESGYKSLDELKSIFGCI